MKPLSKTYKQLGIDFTFPIDIKDANGNRTYCEYSTGYWWKREYDANGKETYFETSYGNWSKREYDTNGNLTYFEGSDDYWGKREYDTNGKQTYFENSNGCKRGTPRSKSCDDTIEFNIKLDKVLIEEIMQIMRRNDKRKECNLTFSSAKHIESQWKLKLNYE